MVLHIFDMDSKLIKIKLFLKAWVLELEIAVSESSTDGGWTTVQRKAGQFLGSRAKAKNWFKVS